jgi:hypothetical protein
MPKGGRQFPSEQLKSCRCDFLNRPLRSETGQYRRPYFVNSGMSPGMRSSKAMSSCINRPSTKIADQPSGTAAKTSAMAFSGGAAAIQSCFLGMPLTKLSVVTSTNSTYWPMSRTIRPKPPVCQWPTSVDATRPSTSPLPFRFSGDREGRIQSTGTCACPCLLAVAPNSDKPRNQGTLVVLPCSRRTRRQRAFDEFSLSVLELLERYTAHHVGP